MPKRVLLLDTNLLLVYIASVYSDSIFARHKKLKGYSHHDGKLLWLYADLFDATVTLPQILAETSNLAGMTGEPDRSGLLNQIGLFMSAVEEMWHPCGTIAMNPSLCRLGVADAAIETAALMGGNEGLSVLTDDVRLLGQLASQGIEVANFNHVRQYNWKTL